MPLISVSDELAGKSFTSVENKFITKYLPVLEPNAVKVYLYSLYIYQNGLNALTVEDLANSLSLTVEQTEGYFEYLEELELAAILTRTPFSVKILDSANVYGAPKKFKPEKYADFTKSVQAIIKGRMITTNEFREYFLLLEDYGFEQNALIMIISYCAGLKGDNVKMQYIRAVAKSFAAEGAVTAQRVDERLADYDTVSLAVKEIFGILGITRKPELDDKKLYKRWTEKLGFNEDAIKTAVKCFKAKSMEKLNTALEELSRNKKLDVKEIENYSKTRTAALNATYDIAKIIDVKMQLPTVYLEKYVNGWCGYGYSLQSLRIIAELCRTQDKKSFDEMNETVIFLCDGGIISDDAVRAYTDEIRAQDAFLRKILTACGMTRKIIDGDRQMLARWREWNFTDEMIEEAAKISSGKSSPLAYMNTVLSSWKAENIFSTDKIQTRKPAAASGRADRAEIERHFYDLRHAAEDAAEEALNLALKDAVYGKIHKELNELSIQLAFAEIRDADKAKELSAKIGQLENEGDRRLKEIGLNKLDFIPHYSCDKCNDTGYDKNGNPCDCMKKFIATLK